MVNLLIALAAGAVAWLLSIFVLDWFWAGLPLFLLVTAVVYFVQAKKVRAEVESLMTDVQHQMQKGVGQARSMKQRDMAIDKAIELLKEGYKFKRRQFFIEPQIHGQIGQLHYLKKDFDRARGYLERAFTRDPMSHAMLACIHYRNKDLDKMREAFEKAVKHGKKDSLFWNLYAWCLWKSKERDEAIEVLLRGKTETNNDERVQSNLEALRNKRKMKMRGYQEQWYIFQLEPPPQPKQRIDRRSLRGR